MDSIFPASPTPRTRSKTRWIENAVAAREYLAGLVVRYTPYACDTECREMCNKSLTDARVSPRQCKQPVPCWTTRRVDVAGIVDAPKPSSVEKAVSVGAFSWGFVRVRSAESFFSPSHKYESFFPFPHRIMQLGYHSLWRECTCVQVC